jgi:hypothetical protein
MKLRKEYYENSIYILSDDDFDEIDAWNELNDEEVENYEFVEFDKSVANHYNVKNCAIFHLS